MTETALRDLLDHAVSSDEPPLHTDILGGAIRAAHAARRRRLAASVAVAAVAVIVAGAAIGAAGLSRAAGHATAHRGLAVSPQHGAIIRRTAAPGGGDDGSSNWGFVRPVLPASVPEIDPVPETPQALGQLLIDDMPAGLRLPEVRVRQFDGLDPRQDTAGFASLKTRAGGGYIDGSMDAPGSADQQAVQCLAGDPCRLYRLPGGIEVMEQVQTHLAGEANLMAYTMAIYRPGGVTYWIQENNYPFTGQAGYFVAARPPLTFAQLARIVLDPRWRFTMSKSFVAAAANLRYRPDGAG